MRGLMAKPSGEIIETPIISNFKEGLTVLEYFNSTHGARKGLADTALKTANSGYLTRRLVDVAQDAIITEEDCGTRRGLTMRAVVEGGDVIAALADRILGRCAAVDIVDPLSKKVLLKAGDLIDEENVEVIEQAGIDQVLIRSVLTCETRSGLCGKCYGRDLARGTTVNMGEAVGVIAAQSIGEPGTQLTMRTFHIGGAVQRGAEQSSVEAAFDAKVKIVNRNVVINSAKVPVVMSRNSEVVLLDEASREKAKHRVPYGAKLLADDGATVTKGQKLAEWDPYTIPIITERDGVAHYVDLTRRRIDARGGRRSHRHFVKGRDRLEAAAARQRSASVDHVAQPRRQCAETLERRRGPLLHVGRRHSLGRERRRGQGRRRAGAHPARILQDPRHHRRSAARRGTVRSPQAQRLRHHQRGRWPRRVRQGLQDQAAHRRRAARAKGPTPIEYLIPKGKHISVQEGDNVQKGDLLMDGNPVPHDILRVLGVEALASYLVNEIQEVYRLQGVRINDKHIEVIVRQMLQKVEIEDPGETTYLAGEQIDRIEFEAVNAKAEADGLRPARAHAVLQGITKASLQTNSFFSAASFQETTRVLTEAAVSGRVDTLTGLKENVIVGRLIPAGTGSVMAQWRSIAATRDSELAAKQPEEAAPVPAIEGSRKSA